MGTKHGKWMAAGLVAILGVLIVGMWPGATEAGKPKIKTKVNKVEVAGAGNKITAKVGSRKDRCQKRRRGVLKGPMSAGRGSERVVLDKSRSNNKGKIVFDAPEGTFFMAGVYVIVIRQLTLNRFVCLAGQFRGTL